jgi:N-acetylmuramoyl-L-alanine amidase
MIDLRSISLLISVLFFFFPVRAQYPALTKVITWEELQKRAVERKMDWKNPDGTEESITITEMAIPIDSAMVQRTRKFVEANYGLHSIWLDPHAIVVHAMGDGTLKRSLEISSFLNDEIPSTWGILYKAGLMPNGVHFIVERDGQVICLTPPIHGLLPNYDKREHRWIIKRHQDANPVAIGIENVTAEGDWTGLTEEQIKSNSKLVRWLVWFENGKIEFLTSHHQFNSDAFADRFLYYFGLHHVQPQYRTRSRKDVGDKNLREIQQRVNERGWGVKLFE